MDYLLIHGYGVGASYLNFHQAESEDAGFGAFDELIMEKKAKVFRWDIPKYFGYKTFFNPFNHLKLYNEEWTKSQSILVHIELSKTIENYLPTTIVCHSMGALLITSFLKNNQLPNCVKNIVIVQGDVPYNTSVPQNIESLIKHKKLNIINLYCPWDQALLTSLPLNFELNVGLVGYKNPLIQNIFFPLYKKANLHTSSINDKNLIKLLKNYT